MKKRILCLLCTAMMLTASFTSALAFTTWESPRYVPDDVKEGYPKTVEGNPYVTYYAPWLRQLHLMTATEAANNKAAGITGGEACQQIRQLSVSPVDSNIMYLCSDTSGVYKTTDGGVHWYSTTNNAAGHDAKGLLCDKFDGEIVYVYMRKVGVHRSRDGGYTWEQIVEDKDETQDGGLRSDTIVQDDAGNTYMCVGNGIYKLDRATDTVTNLTAKQFPELAELTGEKNAEFLDMAVSPNGQIIYACCVWTESGSGVATGLYVSEDGGANWKVRNSGSDGSVYSDIRTIALDPRDTTCKTLYAGLRITPTGSSTAGDYTLYKSTDGGKSWTSKNYSEKNGSGDKIYFYGLKFGPKTADGNYPLYLHLHNTNWPLRVSCDYADKSTPTFSQVYQSIHNMNAGTIREGYTGHLYQAFVPDMRTEGTNNIRVIYAASGIYEYTGTYSSSSFIGITTKKITKKEITRISSGYSGACATDIAFDSQNRMFMTVTDVGTYINDGGAYTANSYPNFKEGDGTDYGVRAVFDPNNDEHVIIYVGKSNGNGTYCGIKQSSNGGANFGEKDAEGNLVNDGFADGAKLAYADALYGNAMVLCYDNKDENIIYSSYHNSDDNGTTWTPNECFILDVHPKNTKLQVGIKGTSTDTMLYKTTDGGASWTEVTKLGFSNITDADFDLNNSNYIWLVRDNSSGSKALVRMDLSTGKLTDYTSKFDYKAFRQIEINPKDPNHILVTSYPGRIHSDMYLDFKLAESYDGGETWHTVPGLWGGNFNNIIFSPTTDEAFIIGLAGTFIYDYNELNYQQAMKFNYDGQSVIKELLRVDENGKNVNNGKFVIAPEDLFKPKNMRFEGWKIGEKIYQTGEMVPIPD